MLLCVNTSILFHLALLQAKSSPANLSDDVEGQPRFLFSVIIFRPSLAHQPASSISSSSSFPSSMSLDNLFPQVNTTTKVLVGTPRLHLLVLLHLPPDCQIPISGVIYIYIKISFHEMMGSHIDKQTR